MRAPTRHSVLGVDAAVEIRLDHPALVLEEGDHLPAGFDDEGIEGLFEARLLDRDRFGQLPPSRRQRLENRLFGVRKGAQFVGHRMSKARNQACVQLVGLGDQALGVAKRLDAPGIDHENVQVSLDQRRDQLSPIAADRLERHLGDAPLSQGGDDRFDPRLAVARPDRLGERVKPKVKPGRADVNAGRKRCVNHGIGPVLYAGSPSTALATVRNNNPHPGPSQQANSPAVHHSKDETGMPTIAGRDDPILTESLLRYRMPAFASMTNEGAGRLGWLRQARPGRKPFQSPYRASSPS